MGKKKAVKELEPNIKVQLDRKTVITLKDPSKLEFWSSKFPKLVVLD